ncbi:MAG TPA: AAA family ATPase, partial [Myxococcota bacterium]|nr:AAA family ATPase [Myxococcota bacterium]
MYLESLTLKNLRRCRDLRMDFTRGGKPRMWTVLIGENGTGKTTILQAIALAAAGNRQAAALAGSCVPHLRDRRNDSRLEIDADFRFGPEGCREPKVHPRLPLGEFEALPEGLGLWSQVRLKKGSSSFSATSSYRTPRGRLWAGEDPLDEAREDKHRHLWFVVGYGVHRVLPSAGRVPDLSNPATNRMRPLFDPDSVPASTSFINYFGGGKKARQYSAALKEVI